MSKQGYKYFRKTFTEDGIRYEVSGSTETEAVQKMLEKKAQLRSGMIDSNMTVRAWAAVWLDTYVKPRGLTDKSYHMYEQKLDAIILPALGKYKLRSVNPTMLQRVLNTRQGFSASDTGKVRMVMRAMFRQAYLDRLLEYDPAEGLKLPKVTQGTHRSLTAEERAALLTVANMPTISGKKNNSGMWFKCLLYCGLRPGEAAALRWADVDLKTGYINIRSAKESGSKAIKAPKTDAGVRSVPIPAAYLAELQQYGSGKKPQQFVFTQRDGKTPHTDTSIRRMWETAKKYMDIELGAKVELVKPEGKRKHVRIVTKHVLADDLDLYSLRHTYCTDLQRAGVPINVAKTLMGHSDISVTANIYTHTETESLEEARRLINTMQSGN